MVCMPHRLQCITPHFPKHKFPIQATRNVQTQLKSTVYGGGGGGVKSVVYRGGIFFFGRILLYLNVTFIDGYEI